MKNVVCNRHAHHFVLGFVETLGDVVDGLVLSDGILLERRLGRIEGSDLRLASQTVFELTE